MNNDDSKLQIPLFDTDEISKPEQKRKLRKDDKAKPVEGIATKGRKEKNNVKSMLNLKGSAAKPAKSSVSRNKSKTREKLSGQIPAGDMRLTANIREDLHLKLKIAAAKQRTTIGELIELLVEQHL